MAIFKAMSQGLIHQDMNVFGNIFNCGMYVWKYF